MKCFPGKSKAAVVKWSITFFQQAHGSLKQGTQETTCVLLGQGWGI